MAPPANDAELPHRAAGGPGRGRRHRRRDGEGGGRCLACRQRAWRTTRSTSSSAVSPASQGPARRRGAVRDQGSAFITSADGCDPDQRPRRARRESDRQRLSDRREFKAKGARHRHGDRHCRAAHRRQGPAAVRLGDARSGCRSATRCSRSAPPFGFSRRQRRASSAQGARCWRPCAGAPSSNTDAAVNPATRWPACSTTAVGGGPASTRRSTAVGRLSGPAVRDPINVALKVMEPDRRHRQGAARALGVTIQDPPESGAGAVLQVGMPGRRSGGKRCAGRAAANRPEVRVTWCSKSMARPSLRSGRCPAASAPATPGETVKRRSGATRRRVMSRSKLGSAEEPTKSADAGGKGTSSRASSVWRCALLTADEHMRARIDQRVSDRGGCQASRPGGHQARRCLLAMGGQILTAEDIGSALQSKPSTVARDCFRTGSDLHTS